MKTRIATQQDAEGLWQLRNQALRHGCAKVYDAPRLQAFTPDIMPEGMRKTITEHQVYVIDAPDAGFPCACGYLDLVTGNVEAIFTHPDYQGRGLASAIISSIKQQATALGMSQLTLSSTPNAVGFYQTQGFTIVSQGKYYSQSVGAYLDCVEMIWVDE